MTIVALIVGVVVCAVIVALIGYLSGKVAQRRMNRERDYQNWIAASISAGWEAADKANEKLTAIPRSCRTCAYLSSSGDAYYCKKHNSGGVHAGAILTLEGCDDWELIRTGPPCQVKPKESKDGN